MLFDIGVSFIIVSFLSASFEVPITISMILLSVVFNLFPDVDAFVDLFHLGKLGGTEEGFHRAYTHFPLVYIPIVGLAFIFFGSFIGTLFGLNIFMHFLHDTLFTGWGLKWLYPFSKKQYKLLSDKKGAIYGNKLLVSWSPEELIDVMKKYGEEDWFKKYYLSFHPVVIVEVCVFLVGTIFVLRQFL